MRWISLFVILVLLFAGSVNGQSRFSHPGGSHHSQEKKGSPALILERGVNDLIRFMRQSGARDRQQLMEFVEKRVVPHFDFSHMAKLSTGRQWRRMGEKRRDRVVNRLKDEFLGVMVQRLSGYSGQGARVVGVRRTGEKEVAVAVMLENPQGYPARLGFKLHRNDTGWKVFDVSANGSSAVMHYRQQFRQMLRSRRPQSRSTMNR
ncbi:MAG: ABC transporter substrate-binding protein [Candidatus Sedimenticola sp. (ex Thyasira tokunagai)]